MTLTYFLIGGIVLTGLLLLVLAIRYKYKLKPLKAALERLSSDDKMKVFNLISTHTDRPQTGAILVPVGETDERDLFVRIPEALDNKWKGKSFRITFSEDQENPDIEIEIVRHQDDYSVLGKMKFIPVLIPRVVTKSGKVSNTWSARNLLGRNKQLKSLIKSFIENKHEDLLTSILVNKPTLKNYYEPLYQIRIGDGVQWIQSREFVKCDICKKEMKYIFNLPGEYSDKKGYGEFIYYVFGCETHPDFIKNTMQAF